MNLRNYPYKTNRIDIIVWANMSICSVLHILMPSLVHVLLHLFPSKKKSKIKNQKTIISLRSFLTCTARISSDVTLLSVQLPLLLLLQATAPNSCNNSISRSKSFLLSAATSPSPSTSTSAPPNDAVSGPNDNAFLTTPSYTVAFSLLLLKLTSTTASLILLAATTRSAANGTMRPLTALAYATSAVSFVFSLNSFTAVKS